MLPKQLGGAASKHIGRRRRCTKDVPKAVHAAALEIDARKQRLSNARPTILEQSIGLLGIDDVSGKQDHPSRLHAGEHIREWRRYLGAVETDDEKLSDRGQARFQF